MQNALTQSIDFIESNLEEELSVSLIAKAVAISEYHFHRLFSYHFGIPVMSYVRLLRFKRAAFRLAYRKEMAIVDIAMECGYESHEAFSRAFKQQFHISPSEFRKSPNWSHWQHHYQSILSARNKTVNTINSTLVEICDFPEIQIAVLEHRGSPRKLHQSISTFIQWRKQHRLSPNRSRTFNLIYDDPANTKEEDYRFGIGCEITSGFSIEDPTITRKKIPCGLCARIRHIGSDDTIGASVKYLYDEWLAQSKFSLRDFPLFFERVKFFPDVPETEMITDVYLPIQ